MRVNVYVDGFNLYFRALKHTPHKWLDLSKLAALMLPQHTIHRIRYFTAKAAARTNPQTPIKQETYLRALRTIPNLTIHLGQFLSGTAMQKLVVPLSDGTKFVKVHSTREKGSDVNLASYLLLDACTKDCEGSAVITNDSDQKGPIEMVRNVVGVPVEVLDPCSGRVSRQLQAAATGYKPIRPSVLAASQFPPTLKDQHGTITKPSVW